MNYCPLLHIPEQLQWGHEKEDVAANKYYKKVVKAHKDLSISKCGLVINQEWPYLGASPDRIRYCGCQGKFLIECKSLFAKRNRLPLVASSDKLQKMPNGDVKLKQKTSWYYQIQGQMAITEVGNTDLLFTQIRTSWLCLFPLMNIFGKQLFLKYTFYEVSWS